MQYSDVEQDPLDLIEKVGQVFGNLCIDKRRLPQSQLKQRGVPSYVGEWVLDTIVHGTGELSEADAQKVQQWAARAIPGPDDQNMIKSRLLRGETVKILTPLQIDIILNRKRQDRIAKLTLIGITDAHISDELDRKYPGLAKQGMWGITELVNTPEGVAVTSFQPMQSAVDLTLWKDARRQFNLSEWRSLMILSMGYSPEAFTVEEQGLLLCRLLPLVQKNMHLIELAPKGTGKSYVYENISPMVRLVSGGNISPAVLFVNNANGLPGILARYKVVVLDEVQTLKFEKPEEIIGGLKGYLANAQLTRGGLHQISSDCGLVLLANIRLDEQQRPIADPLIRELPPFLQETAFLDRIRGIIPGWEIRKLTGNSFASSIGLKSDFFGDALIALRDDLSADQICTQRIQLAGTRAYRRNEESVRALASGLMKILFPHCECTQIEFQRYCVEPALHLRQLIWNQLYSLDAEYRQFDKYLEVA
jgi:ATP-dependent Lon protease